jgi:hypothetical protein
MSMKDVLNELKTYLSNTPQQQLAKDWARYDTPENNVGPTIDQFLLNCHYYHLQSNYPLDSGLINFNLNNLNPKFSSGIFLTNSFN